MEKIAQTAYEQLKCVGVPCEDMFSYHGLAEFIRIGRRGTMSIEEKKDGKEFEYSSTYVPKKYVKRIEKIMKNLGIERYMCPPKGDQ